jgi:hypothetical protein
MTTYVVIENAGYIGEIIVREAAELTAATKWKERQYRGGEAERLHVQIAVLRNGVPHYEY